MWCTMRMADIGEGDGARVTEVADGREGETNGGGGVR